MNRFPTNVFDITRSDPVLAALRALRDKRQRGELTDAEYRTAFGELNRQTGPSCDACGATPASILTSETPQRTLCGACELVRRGLS